MNFPANKISVLINTTRMPPRATPMQQHSVLTRRAVELRNSKKEAIQIAESQYQYNKCIMRNHLTTACMYKKKEGYWRYGGKYVLKACRILFLRILLGITITDQEKAS